MPTPYVPPQQPVAVPVQVATPTQVKQGQNQNSDILIEDKNDSRSDSQSSSRSDVIQAPVNAQTNISNNNSDYFGFGVGITRPVPTFFGHVTLDDYSESVHLGFQIPIAGKTGRLSDEFIANNIYAQNLSNATSEMSFCNSLYKQGITIDYTKLPENHPAHRCDGLIVSKVIAVPPVPVPVAQDNEMSELRKVIEYLKEQNKKLQRLVESKYQADTTVVDDGG